MRKIAVAISKGGVGKSTTAVSVAACIADAGRRVLLVDTDTQAQCSKMLGVSPTAGLAELLDGSVKPDAALTEARPNLWLLAGGQALGEAKRSIAQKEFRSEAVLAEALSPYDGRFDFAILDSGPGWDSLTINLLFAADAILCPVSLEALSVDGFLSFAKAIEPVQRYRAVAVRWIVPTFEDGRVKKSSEILSQIEKAFPEQVTHPIHYSVKLSEAPAFGQTIFEYAPKDRGALDYAKLAGRILRDAT